MYEKCFRMQTQALKRKVKVNKLNSYEAYFLENKLEEVKANGSLLRGTNMPRHKYFKISNFYSLHT